MTTINENETAHSGSNQGHEDYESDSDESLLNAFAELFTVSTDEDNNENNVDSDSDDSFVTNYSILGPGLCCLPNLEALGIFDETNGEGNEASGIDTDASLCVGTISIPFNMSANDQSTSTLDTKVVEAQSPQNTVKSSADTNVEVVVEQYTGEGARPKVFNSNSRPNGGVNADEQCAEKGARPKVFNSNSRPNGGVNADEQCAEKGARPKVSNSNSRPNGGVNADEQCAEKGARPKVFNSNSRPNGGVNADEQCAEKGARPKVSNSNSRPNGGVIANEQCAEKGSRPKATDTAQADATDDSYRQRFTSSYEPDEPEKVLIAIVSFNLNTT
ncbi:hypothetical protein EGW08_020756 [Elysia chlorotica]|uniref:Uncharacterized protein n=1 Tax=Elysia chlorotica TaxID=188477 RepID=A0A433SQK5_ELYCH|nr:hypothetical protein EGW08_020756 [Elysia chlorotica]